MSAVDHRRDLLVIRLKATAALSHQMAGALLGKGQDELRAHFEQTAVLMTEAVSALTPIDGRGGR